MRRKIATTLLIVATLLISVSQGSAQDSSEFAEKIKRIEEVGSGSRSSDITSQISPYFQIGEDINIARARLSNAGFVLEEGGFFKEDGTRGDFLRGHRRYAGKKYWLWPWPYGASRIYISIEKKNSNTESIQARYFFEGLQ